MNIFSCTLLTRHLESTVKKGIAGGGRSEFRGIEQRSQTNKTYSANFFRIHLIIFFMALLTWYSTFLPDGLSFLISHLPNFKQVWFE